MARPFFRLLTELSSRKSISRITGSFAKSSLSRRLIPWFAKTYNIRLEDAEKQWQEYRSLNDFFTRRLKKGLRPIDKGIEILASPVDAAITGMGNIQSGQLLNIKGQNYTLEQLLNQSPRLVNYIDGFYFVLYLSPTDYHRIHTPISGKIIEKEHIAGKVYPVNEFGLRHMRTVLSRNERLVTYMQHEFGEIAVVKVGAMNVSSIQYVNPLSETLVVGDELAYFEFGSTVVLLIENHTFTSKTDLKVGSKVRMGEALGQLHVKHE
jgi:phosphatidylserine decarboxylase